MRLGIIDLSSIFWTIAGTRAKGEGAHGLARQALDYVHKRVDDLKVDGVVFACDGPSGSSWRVRVDPQYKADRKPKDEAQREELTLLIGALVDSGFGILNETEGDGGAGGGPVYWFEADDLAGALAVKCAKLGHEAVMLSDDWDLAQVLPDEGQADPPRISLFTTKGEPVTAASVVKHFGVQPSKLAQLKALAGDGDGYKPFPGPEKGKPGIGNVTARDLLTGFGSAQVAVAAAVGGFDEQFKEKGFAPRIADLLRAGGDVALKRGLACAELRLDAPVAEDFEEGSWEDAEATLKTREPARPAATRASGRARVKEEPRVATPPNPGRPSAVPREGASHDPNDHGGTPHDEDETSDDGTGHVADEPPAPRVDAPALIRAATRSLPDDAEVERLAERSRAGERTTVSPEMHAALEACGSGDEPPTRADRLRSLGVPVLELDDPEPGDGGTDRDEPLDWDRMLEGLSGGAGNTLVLVTDAEFMALAPLPALKAAGVFAVPACFPDLHVLLLALANGALKPTADRRVYIGHVAEEVAKALSVLGAAASQVRNGIAPSEEWQDFIEQLKGLRIDALADYGAPLVRAR